ncbi:PREDICTED: methyl-CpG-binding domain-containing protein 1-like [Camelina sativa]|uniref:Methyl-CpG-binding domain-containing protein 1-like n=1 Tax=Camelina sativa TaxID=90675 RepID=A0ABM0V065_CAMSA|nr:PREDICTED: methyl-CpG-binding domain-containing protein 1-like [Camelina sativa]
MDAESSNSTCLKRKAKSSSEWEIDIFAVQCAECQKWRKLNSQEDYELFRSRQLEEQFVCEEIEGVSCEDAGDIEYDSSNTWVTEKPGLPETPEGFKRSYVMRKDYSKMDVYYVTSTGKKLKTLAEIEAFIAANEEFNAPLEDFNFTVPKVMEDTVPKPSKEND